MKYLFAFCFIQLTFQGSTGNIYIPMEQITYVEQRGTGSRVYVEDDTYEFYDALESVDQIYSEMAACIKQT